MKVKVPAVLTFKAEGRINIYPYYVSLKESLRAYRQISNKIDDKIA